MIKTEVVKLTPELAASLLQKNNSNRPMSKATLERYEKAIKRGEWQLNGEAIIVFSDGNLGNGQHRCWAVINTGIAIDTVIMHGISPESFSTIDGGRKRSAADVLAIKGEINTEKLSAAARTYLLTQLTGRDMAAVTPIQIDKCIENHPHIRYWVQKFVASKKLRTFLPSAACAYLAIASEKYGFEKLDAFFDQLVTGENLAGGDPALVLRDRLMSQTSTQKISAMHVRAFIVKAINAHLLGKKLQILRFTENEVTPKIL